MPDVTRPWSRTEFLALGPDERRRVQIDLAGRALTVWLRFAADGIPDYRDSVVGDIHTVEVDLPADALDCVCRGSDVHDVGHRYLEPIAALQDDDVAFSGEAGLAYYAIYNLFRRYLGHRPSDVDDLDWLIVHQASPS